MKKLLLAVFLLVSSFAAYLNADLTATQPSSLETQGYLYLTFCSVSNEYVTFKLTPYGFSASPTEIRMDFSGSSSSPDCRQLVIFVKADSPGMYNLKIKEGSDEWWVPVVFEKRLPLELLLSKQVIYTGYDSVRLFVRGDGTNAWVYFPGNLVGSNILHSPSLPASFDITFHFSQPGYYAIPVSVRYDHGNTTLVQNYTLGLRVEEPPLEISGSLRIPSEGYADLKLHVHSPEVLYSTKVSVSSECIEGDTERFFPELSDANVTFKIRGKCDPGIYPLIVQVGSYSRTLPLEIYGPGGFDVMISPGYEKGKASIEVTVANIGSDTMKSVSVKLLPGNYIIDEEGTFLGDLDPGDFDSADLSFTPRGNPVLVRYQIAFNKAGERVVLNRTYEFTAPREGGFPWIWLLVTAAVVYYAYTRKAGRKVSHS